MRLPNWLRKPFAGPHTPRRRPSRRLTVEQLEDRTVPSLAFGSAFGIGGSDVRPDVGSAIAVDGDGNQYVLGSFFDTIDMDPGPGQDLLTSAGGSDLFVAKYNPAGGLLWAARTGGPELDSGGGDLAVDGAGNVFVTGRLRGTADLGSFTLTSQGVTDVFIAKLDTAGIFQWATRLGADNDATLEYWEAGSGIAVDDTGNVYTTGRLFDSGTTGNTNIIFVAKHDTNGAMRWLKTMGEAGSGGGEGNDLALDGAGNAYVTGGYAWTVDFDPGSGAYNLSSVNTQDSSGYRDAFVLKLDAGGNFVWAGSMGGASHDVGNDITVNGDRQVYVVGDFVSTSSDCDPGPSKVNLANAGGSDVFVVKFDANRNLLWARSMGGPGEDVGRGIGVDGTGEVYVTGKFVQTADFDPSAASFNLTSTSTGDAFVSRLDSAGNFVWAGQMGSPGFASANDLALDGASNVHLTGFFSRSADFDPGPGEYLLHSTLDSNGNPTIDAFVAKLIQTDAPPAPSASLSINDVSVTEGNVGTTTTTFTITRSGDTTQEITVNYATGDGSAIVAGNDYVAASDTLTFAPGQTSKTVAILINGDRLGEPNETFVVNLSGATNATIADSQGVGTILDDEPRISIGDATKSEGRKNKTTLFTFTVTLSAAYDQPVTMSFATVNGTATTSDNDYIAKTGTLTFAPGETTKTITIEVKGDSKREADETFYLDLFGNSGNSLFTKNRGLGTILNDD